MMHLDALICIFLKHKTLQFSELQRFSIKKAEREGFEPPDL